MLAALLNLGFAGGTAPAVITPMHEALGLVRAYFATEGTLTEFAGGDGRLDEYAVGDGDLLEQD